MLSKGNDPFLFVSFLASGALAMQFLTVIVRLEVDDHYSSPPISLLSDSLCFGTHSRFSFFCILSPQLLGHWKESDGAAARRDSNHPPLF